MYSNKVSKYLINTITSVSVLMSVILSAEDVAALPRLTIKPTQCVSLRQGQSCFVTADISWQVAKTDDYCLYSTEKITPLKCWLSVNAGHFIEDIELKENITFTLKAQNDTRSIVSEVLELAWVYKAQRLSHSSWRVF
jgi:hypothetical protein